MDISQSMDDLLFAPGSDLGAGLVAVRVALLFIIAICYVRLAKKRFIAQATAMDLVMAVILGSTLSRGINGGASLISCIEAGIGLVILHRTVSFLSARSSAFGRLVKGNMNVIVRDGKPDFAEMRKHDITENDLHQELRMRTSSDDLSQIQLAVLERSGHIGFVKS